MSWQVPLAANSGAIHSEADANQPLQHLPLTASSAILTSQMLSTNCRGEAQDTSGLETFLPPDASHGIDSIPEFSSQVLNFDRGSNEISNFHGFPYSFDPNQEFNFDIPFDPSLLDLGKNDNTPDLMLPFSPGSTSHTHSTTTGYSTPTPASAFTPSAFNDAFIHDAAHQRTVSSNMPGTAESMLDTRRITSTSIEPTSSTFHDASDTTNMRSAAPECTFSSHHVSNETDSNATDSHHYQCLNNTTPTAQVAGTAALAYPPKTSSLGGSITGVSNALSHSRYADTNNVSWATRNPSRAVIDPRPPPARLTDAHKASRAIAHEQRKLAQESLDEDIKQFLTKQNDEIAKIAAAHNVKVDKVKDLVGFNIHYKKQRKPTLHNAILHLKATEINQDLPPGQKTKLSELKTLVDDDDTFKNLSKEQEDELINNLIEHRDNRKHGVRANNAAAARDILCTGDAMTDLLDGCAHRTGSYGFYFLTRGHVNDTAEATWYGSDNSMDFLEDVMQLEPSEICRLFEQWACSRHQSADERDSLDNVRKQCTRGILKGLRTLKNNKKLEMNYVNYDKVIVLGLGVKLIGWPKAIGFAKPSSIGSVVDARMLRDALKSGECHWIKLTTRQINDHRRELENREAEGEMIGKPRKRRSDAGKKRKGRLSDNIENEPPTKKTRRTTKSAKMAKRPVHAASDDEDNKSESGSDLYG